MNKPQWAVFEQSGLLTCLFVQKHNSRSVTVDNGAKVPRHRLWMLLDSDCAPLLPAVAAHAGQFNIEAVWQAAAGQALSAADLAQKAGAKDTAEALAVLQTVLDNPAYFRRDNGMLHPVKAETLIKIRTALAHRAASSEEEQRLLEELTAGRVPAAVAACRAELLAAENKNSAVFRAVKKAAGGERHVAEFLVKIGACADARACWGELFKHRWPARPQLAAPLTDGMSIADSTVRAFSIDDSGTFEVDDAFSARSEEDGRILIGLHIAVPAVDTELFGDLNRRLTSVYFPDEKHPMLTVAHIARYSLAAGGFRPALSLYYRFDPQSGAAEEAGTRLERIFVSGNYCPEDFAQGAPAAVAEPYRRLCAFAETLPPLPERNRDNYRITAPPPQITFAPRRPTGLLVEKMMRQINAVWGQRLTAGEGGLFRSNGATVVKAPAANIYAWVSSPLRRYIDLANQRLLLAILNIVPLPDIDWRRLARAYGLQQMQARHYQSLMERHWVLCALNALPSETVLRARRQDRGKARLLEYPLAGTVVNATGALPENEELQVRLHDLDFFSQRVRLALV